MAETTRSAAICDANILIDYIDADEDILRELVKYWGTVYVPDRVLAEASHITKERTLDITDKITKTNHIAESGQVQCSELGASDRPQRLEV